MKRAKRLQLQERIKRNCQVHDKTGCWLWTARINNQGYPTMSMRLPDRDYPVPMFAHRVSLMAFKSLPKEGEQAAHCPRKCPDHRHCVNPDHLRWASQSENLLDNTRKSRLRLREVHPPLHGLEFAD
jgi:hypothetical protein